MYITVKQFEQALVRYYKDFQNNPDSFDVDFENLDPVADAKEVTKILVQHILEAENQ